MSASSTTVNKPAAAIMQRRLFTKGRFFHITPNDKNHFLITYKIIEENFDFFDDNDPDYKLNYDHEFIYSYHTANYYVRCLGRGGKAQTFYLKSNLSILLRFEKVFEKHHLDQIISFHHVIMIASKKLVTQSPKKTNDQPSRKSGISGHASDSGQSKKKDRESSKSTKAKGNQSMNPGPQNRQSNSYKGSTVGVMVNFMVLFRSFEGSCNGKLLAQGKRRILSK
ncbi:hypothetical protein C1646_664029 [Rhizophagus diaphanus]|nr:hypothetical protein C1646_664029 [Rhizophagus diaphanus] [Rhizophagus sp. MUCL 43196]